MSKEYIKFQTEKETLDFLKKYDIIPKTYSSLPIFWYKTNWDKTHVECEVLGYEKEYDGWATLVIEHGTGPDFIHCDFFKEMQELVRNKGISLSEYTDTFTVIDLETTGVNVRLAEIIEIAAIKYVNNKEVAVFNEFVRPKKPIPKKVTELTGITDLHVCNADDISVVLNKFIDFIGDSILVGHNIGSFDLTLIYDYAKRLYGIDVSNNYIDTKYIAQSQYKDVLSNCKLSTVAEYFGIDTSGAHRALEDCRINAECYMSMFNQTTSSEGPKIELSKINNITNDFDQLVSNILQEMIFLEELPSNSLYISSNLTKQGEVKSQSICVNEPDYPPNSHNVNRIGKNDTFLKYEYNTTLTLHIRDNCLKSLTIPDFAIQKKTKADGLFTRIIFNSIEDNIDMLGNLVKTIVKIGLDYYESGSSFGCCSQFMKCSDAKKCVHENKLYSKGCQYRKNLDAGRIFYGKNRNID